MEITSLFLKTYTTSICREDWETIITFKLSKFYWKMSPFGYFQITNPVPFSIFNEGQPLN